MSNTRTLPALTLFPLYSGGKIIRRLSGYTAQSVFRTIKNDFSPGYDVNKVPEGNILDTLPFFDTNDRNRLTSQTSAPSAPFNKPLQLDGTSVKAGTVPSVAPNIPTSYLQLASYLEISDLNFATLINQTEFLIPTIGMGLKVTTDGAGNVTSLSLAPSSQGIIASPSSILPEFGGLNRANITQGAIFKVDNPGFQLGGSIQSTDPINTEELSRTTAALILQLYQNTLNNKNQQPSKTKPEPFFNTLGKTPTSESLFNNTPSNKGLKSITPLRPEDTLIQNTQAVNINETQPQIISTPFQAEGSTVNNYQTEPIAEDSSETYFQEEEIPIESLMDGRVNIIPGHSMISDPLANQPFLNTMNYFDTTADLSGNSGGFSTDGSQQFGNPAFYTGEFGQPEQRSKKEPQEQNMSNLPKKPRRYFT